jgi:hypothetical protein
LESVGVALVKQAYLFLLCLWYPVTHGLVISVVSLTLSTKERSWCIVWLEIELGFGVGPPVSMCSMSGTGRTLLDRQHCTGMSSRKETID